MLHREHEVHITINRIKFYKLITNQDLEILEEILFEEVGITKQELARIYGTEKPLSCLIREIVGLDRNVAMKAFSDLLAKTT